MVKEVNQPSPASCLHWTFFEIMADREYPIQDKIRNLLHKKDDRQLILHEYVIGAVSLQKEFKLLT